MIAKVRLWGRTIGAVSLAPGRDVAAFQYDPQFARSGIELAPLAMPLSERVYEFPALPRHTFHGLPGLLADSLPDKFGNALIDAWLATQGRTPESFNAVERLCYIGTRGMGALEFAPVMGPKPRKAKQIEVDALVRLAGEVLTHRGNVQGYFHEAGKAKALGVLQRPFLTHSRLQKATRSSSPSGTSPACSTCPKRSRQRSGGSWRRFVRKLYDRATARWVQHRRQRRPGGRADGHARPRSRHSTSTG